MDAITHKGDADQPVGAMGEAGADIARALSERLRALRAERAWSLQRAAEACGVSKAMLGQIERGESSPTVALLWRIAGGFGCALSDLLPPQAGAPAEVRDPRRVRARPASDAMLVAPLFAFDPALAFEVFELTLLPGYERVSEPHVAGVVEHVVVQRGSLEVLSEGRWVRLEAGEGLRLAGDREHGYRNAGAGPAVFLDLIHYPRGRGAPAWS
jgi:transcriptional regulator with XRE-family HTH domain